MNTIKRGIKKFIFNHGIDTLIVILSIIILYIGLKMVGAISALVVLILDAIWFLLPVVKKGKNNQSDTMKRKNKRIENVTPKKKKTVWKVIKIILLIFLILFILASIAGGIFIAKIVKDAPKFNPDNLYQVEATIVRYPNGDVWTKLGSQKREIISYNEMSETLINAIVATEDSRFFQHNGFDLPRFAVASFKQLLGKDAGGASTLTMQLSKNYYTSTKSQGIEGIKRKFTDIYMSIFQIEKNYTKKEIMEFYANSNYLGGGSYGVEQACLTYFGKHASELNIAEAALIAGLFQSPDAYDPLKHPEAAEKRRKTVLYLMNRHGYITKAEKKQAEKQTVETLIKKQDDSDKNIKYKAFLDTVIEEIKNDTKTKDRPEGLNPYTTAMDITTTINVEKQEYIDNIMNGNNFEWENENVTAGISVIDNETGALIAVGAGRNRVGNDFNTATETKKQIGSTAKPLYDYGPGIEFENWSTYTPFVDEPYSYTGGTKITNWDGGYNGFMTSRQALVDSRNIPALKAFQANKNSNIKKFVLSLGLHPEGAEGSIHEAHAIGGYTGESPLSMSAAYAAFARGGYYIEPYSYTKIIYRNTDEVFENKKVKTKVMSDATAYMITDMLIDTGKHALSSRYNNINGKEFAAKTGTTNFPAEFKSAHNLPEKAINDLWVIGYNPDYSIGVWYGYLDWKKGYTIHGNFNHARLFQTVASGFFTSDKTYEKPESVAEVTVEYGTNPAALPSEYTPDDKKVVELFKVGTEPTKMSTRYLRLNDPSDIKTKLEGNKLTLTWNRVTPPSALDTSSYGNLGYNVYKQVGSELQLLKFVTDTSYTDTIGETEEKATYVIKSKFSNQDNFMSNGATVNVTLKDSISIAFEDRSSETTLYVGDTYIDPNFVVTVNGKEIFKGNTSKGDVKIEKTIIPPIVTTKPTTVPFVAKYKVTYKDTVKDFARKIIVKEKVQS